MKMAETLHWFGKNSIFLFYWIVFEVLNTSKKLRLMSSPWDTDISFKRLWRDFANAKMFLIFTSMLYNSVSYATTILNCSLKDSSNTCPLEDDYSLNKNVCRPLRRNHSPGMPKMIKPLTCPFIQEPHFSITIGFT